MSEYSEFHYTAGGSTNGEDGAALAAKLVRLVSGLSKVRSICDLGCGNGHLCGLLAEASLQVTGVDASESGLNLARAAVGERARFVCARIDAGLPSKLGVRFDAVISSDVIEHLYRPRDLVECARELLNPGGWLIIGTPYHGYLKNLAISVLGRWDAHHTVDWEGGHIKFFSVKTLSRMVMEGGFDVRRVKYFGRAPGLWKNMICVARKSA